MGHKRKTGEHTMFLEKKKTKKFTIELERKTGKNTMGRKNDWKPSIGHIKTGGITTGHSRKTRKTTIGHKRRTVKPQ